jgi:hypothetical protein
MRISLRDSGFFVFSDCSRLDSTDRRLIRQPFAALPESD